MTEPQRFCVGCKHHVFAVGTEFYGFLQLRQRDVSSHRCRGFRDESTNLVTGVVTTFYPLIPCDVARDSPRICGPEGTRWEAKP